MAKKTIHKTNQPTRIYSVKTEQHLGFETQLAERRYKKNYEAEKVNLLNEGYHEINPSLFKRGKKQFASISKESDWRMTRQEIADKRPNPAREGNMIHDIVRHGVRFYTGDVIVTKWVFCV